MKGEVGRASHRPQRQRWNSLCDDEPDPAIADDILKCTNEKGSPEWQDLTESRCQDPNTITKVFSHTKAGNLALIVAH